MEPLTAGAIAIRTVIATKALEKTGEKVGETLWDRGEMSIRYCWRKCYKLTNKCVTTKSRNHKLRV
jgi:hypothetical protein